MVEVSTLKLRLLRMLARERRQLDYFNGWQRGALIEMISDGLVKARKRDHHTLYITPAGKKAMNSKGVK